MVAGLGIALALGSAAAMLLLCLAGGARPSAAWRVGWWVVVGLGSAAAGATLIGPLGRWRGDDKVARFVDDRTGAGDLYLSAVELAAAIPGFESQPQSGSPGLARAHLSSAAQRLSKADPAAMVEWLPSRRRRAAVVAIAVGYAALLFALRPQLVRGWAALDERPTSVAPANVEPIIGELEVRLTYPKHTGMPPRIIPGSSGTIVAPPGTRVVLRGKPLIAARAAKLELEDAGGQVTSTVGARLEGGTIEASFTVDKPGAWRFRIERATGAIRAVTGRMTGIGGPEVREPEPHQIEVEPDRAPKVELAAPADDLELDGARKVQLAFSVDDDFGLTDVSLVWKQEGAGAGPETRKAVPDLGKLEGKRSVSGTFEWDVGDLDLKPGARVSYRLEARDNDDVSGPNVGVSRSFSLRIYSPAEKHEELLAAEQALADHAVMLLGDRLDVGRVDGGEGHAPQHAADEGRAWTQAHAHSEGFVDEVAKLSGLLEKDPLAPRDLKPALTGMHARLGKLIKEEQPHLADAARAEGGSSRHALRETNPRHVLEMEKDALALADLVERQRLEQLLTLSDELAEARDRLKQLLGDYKKNRTEAGRKEIEKQIHQLERKLAELAAKAARLQGEVPDEFINRDALASEDMQKQLDSLKEMLDKGDVDQAMETLRKLSAQLDKMAQSIEGDLRGFRGERFSAEEKALSELENKLSDLEHDQRQLQSETDELVGKQREEMKRLGKDRVEPFLKRARERTADIKKRLGQVDREPLPPFDQEQFDKARRRVDDLGRALEQGDLEQSEEAARETAGELREVSRRLRDEEERRWEGTRQPVRKAREKVDESEPIARQIADEIQQMMPRPGELLGPEDRKRMGSLAARQQALGKRTDETRRDLEKRLKERAQAEGGPAQGLKEAGDHMGRAAVDQGLPLR